MPFLFQMQQQPRALLLLPPLRRHPLHQRPWQQRPWQQRVRLPWSLDGNTDPQLSKSILVWRRRLVRCTATNDRPAMVSVTMQVQDTVYLSNSVVLIRLCGPPMRTGIRNHVKDIYEYRFPFLFAYYILKGNKWRRTNKTDVLLVNWPIECSLLMSRP